MPDERIPDELDDYLRGGSALSGQYKRESSPPPPHALDRMVLEAARPAPFGSKRPFKHQSLAPLAFAASVLLSLALVLAIIFGPQAKKPDDKPRVMQVRMFKSEPPRASPVSARERNPAAWLADISALRRAGHRAEADVEMRRFRSAYPDYIIPINE
ncbi:MAG TPA: hypothetical protein VGN99_14275 [Steroidobacteraceae bacterium]|nr:hypothetical protein [Steroidobacteraceae bacterium]